MGYDWEEVQKAVDAGKKRSDLLSEFGMASSTLTWATQTGKISRLPERPGKWVAEKESPSRTVLECQYHGLTEFYKAFSQNRYRYRCKRCNADSVTKRKRKMKSELIETLGGCCSRCGYDKTPVALSFHHRDRSTKEFNLSEMTSIGIARLRVEVLKCDLLCLNCHAEVEEELRDV
jgi:hypothetical protein